MNHMGHFYYSTRTIPAPASHHQENQRFSSFASQPSHTMQNSKNSNWDCAENRLLRKEKYTYLIVIYVCSFAFFEIQQSEWRETKKKIILIFPYGRVHVELVLSCHSAR